MADFLPQASTANPSGNGHEPNTLVVKGLIVFAVVLVVVGVVVELCLAFVMNDFSKEERTLQLLAPPKLANDIGPLPGPRLQAEPHVELAKLKEAELRRLTGYGWVNREAGIAHIPIDRAMDIVARKGLSSSGGPGEKKAVTNPAAQPAGLSTKEDRKP